MVTKPGKFLDATFTQGLIEKVNVLTNQRLFSDEYIEGYVAMLDELDHADDLTLIDGNIPKTCKESAD